jgi:uncharacterized protein (DUF58 family)
MIPNEIIRQIKRIEIRTTRLVENIFGGQYLSAFKGHGIEFAEVREYMPGDDIRTIDWNVTARTGTPHVKLFHEERELSLVFAVDISASLNYGTGEKFKSEIAAEICAVLAFSAFKNNDCVGLLLFSDSIEKYIPLKKGHQHALRIIRDVLYYEPHNHKTDIKNSIETLNKILSRQSVVFLISDFLDVGYEKPLKVLSRNHDVIAVHVFDPSETELPNAGIFYVEDPETHQKSILNTSSRKIRDSFQNKARAHKKRLDSFFLSKAIDKIDIDITRSYVDPLRIFFETRDKRR